MHDYKAEFAKREQIEEERAFAQKMMLEERLNEKPVQVEEPQFRKTKFTSIEQIVAALKEQLSTNNKQAVKGLLTIYERQTNDEKAVESTKHDNGVGFTGRDAKFLTSVAKVHLRYGHISAKQMACVRRAMPTYARQLVTLSIEKGKIVKTGNVYSFLIEK